VETPSCPLASRRRSKTPHSALRDTSGASRGYGRWLRAASCAAALAGLWAGTAALSQASSHPVAPVAAADGFPEPDPLRVDRSGDAGPEPAPAIYGPDVRDNAPVRPGPPFDTYGPAGDGDETSAEPGTGPPDEWRGSDRFYGSGWDYGSPSGRDEPGGYGPGRYRSAAGGPWDWGYRPWDWDPTVRYDYGAWVSGPPWAEIGYGGPDPYGWGYGADWGYGPPDRSWGPWDGCEWGAGPWHGGWDRYDAPWDVGPDAAYGYGAAWNSPPPREPIGYRGLPDGREY
jgi:hypothetical protein